MYYKFHTKYIGKIIFTHVHYHKSWCCTICDFIWKKFFITYVILWRVYFRNGSRISCHQNEEKLRRGSKVQRTSVGLGFFERTRCTSRLLCNTAEIELKLNFIVSDQTCRKHRGNNLKQNPINA